MRKACVSVILMISCGVTRIEAPARAAEPPSCLEAVGASVTRNTSLVVIRTEDAPITGRFLRVDADRRQLWLRVYDSGNDRLEKLALNEGAVSGVRVVEKHKSPVLPVAAGVVLGGTGALLGWGLAGSGGGDSDVGRDMRPVTSIYLGATGALVGLIGGMVVTPAHITERDLECGR
jgi:hypothetical protein